MAPRLGYAPAIDAEGPRCIRRLGAQHESAVAAGEAPHQCSILLRGADELDQLRVPFLKLLHHFLSRKLLERVVEIHRPVRGQHPIALIVHFIRHGSLHAHFKGLPPGATWGERVASLRKRRGLSQNAVAARVSVGRDAIIALENRSKGRVDVFTAVLRVLGTKLTFRESAPRSFYTGAGVSSVRMDWRTPRWVLEELYTIFEFDLDAAAATPPNVRAKQHYGAAEDGLFRPLFGQVWINPPYGREIGVWVGKCRREVDSGRASTVIALIPARVGTRWWRDNIVGSASVVFLPGRLRFDDGENSAPFDAALVMWGAAERQVHQVATAFDGSWLALASAGRIARQA